MLGPPWDENKIYELLTVLEIAGRPPRWSDRLPLSTVLTELGRWLSDDRQWASGAAKNWISLVSDLEASINDLPDGALDLVGGRSAVVAPLVVARAEASNSSTRNEPIARRRLLRLCGSLQEGVRDPAAVLACWRAAVELEGWSEERVNLVRNALDLASSLGHDPTDLRRHLERDLLGGRQRPVAPAANRLRRAERRLEIWPAVRERAVWLRIYRARILSDEIALPPHVTLFDGQAYRARLANPALDQRFEAQVPEILADMQGGGGLFGPPQDSDSDSDWRQPPDVYVRVVCQGLSYCDAVREAQRIAELIGAYASLKGAAPGLWKPDAGYSTYFNGQIGGSSTTVPPVGSPTLTEGLAAQRDRSAEDLADAASSLGPFLTSQAPEDIAVGELLSWLRDAEASPAAACLVLCDRIIESVCGWVGLASRSRFVETFLAVSWALGRLNEELHELALAILDADERRFFEHTPERQRWQEVRDAVPFNLEMSDGRYSFSPVGLLNGLDFIEARLPPDGRAGRAITQVRVWETNAKARTRLKTLLASASAAEARRARTRNALVHGGPLAAPTVDAVLPFATYMAIEATELALEARLERRHIGDFFLERSERLSQVHSQLAAGVAPATALFGPGSQRSP